MNIKGIDHIGINTRDFEKTLTLYRDIFGFEELNSVVLDDIVATYLKIPGGGRMEIFDNLGKTKHHDITQLDNGVRHLAFRVEDVEKHAQIMRDNGYEITYGPAELEDFNVRTFLIIDPNGIEVELCEPLK
jgi:glyoxylase I family protein